MSENSSKPEPQLAPKPYKRVRFSEEVINISDTSELATNTQSDDEVNEISNGSAFLYQEVESHNGEKADFPKCSSPIDESVNEENYCVNAIIMDTALMQISDETDEPKTDRIPSGNFPSAYKTLTEKSPWKIKDEMNTVPFTDRKIENCSPPRKRSFGDIQIKKQSLKLKDTLIEKNCDITSALTLKSAVYKAWQELKKEEASQHGLKINPPSNISSVPEKKADTSKEASHQIPTRKRKIHRNINNANVVPKPPQKSKEEIEESKMAFLAWKKKKEENLKQEIAEQCRKKEKERLDKLMNERLKKKDAEEAYSSWISHKAAQAKMEKRKSQWILQKEKEKLEKKVKRDDEAQKAYFEWLLNKVYSDDEEEKVVEDKPPWFPPG